MAEKPTSLARIEANRKNALKSTGPKTPEGKTAVKWNALKHGLLSREVLIRAGDGKESKTEFKNLYTKLRGDLQPEGMLEEMLVERIAVCYWRLRRALRSEIGEIRKGLDSAKWRQFLKRDEQFRSAKKITVYNERRRQLERNYRGTAYLILRLEELITEFEQKGSLSAEARSFLIENFGTEEDSFARSVLDISEATTKDPAKAGKDPSQNSDTPSPDKCKEAILKILRHEKEAMEILRKYFFQMEKEETKATIASLALPSRIEVDKILRYETTIERQLYRAMGQLERLQRRRKGEPTIPPITIDVMKEE